MPMWMVSITNPDGSMSYRVRKLRQVAEAILAEALRAGASAILEAYDPNVQQWG